MPRLDDVVTAILGGGQGARLWPLTRHRAKPAVPLGGKFRLIDVAISNSLHAGVDRIYVLTQFHSASLHRHIAQTYRFDFLREGFVDILAAEQGIDRRDWYQGTADAIRQNLHHLDDSPARDVLVLSGDQLYLMDLAAFVRRHRDTAADITVAVTPVTREQAPAFGIMQVDAQGRVVRFVEKPREPRLLDELSPGAGTLERLGFGAQEGRLLASMGIYAFRRRALDEVLLGSSAADFGRDVIPGAIASRPVYAFAYPGYWRDIGTIPAFHEANLDLTLPLPPLNLYDPERPIYTHARYLPGTKINRCDVQRSVLCEGAILEQSRVTDSIVGIRGIVHEGATVERSIVMGARYFESQVGSSREVRVGVGRDCVVRNAILDLDARVGDGSRLVNEAGVQEADGDGWCIRGGVVVVEKGATIPPGTVV
jgi:glucose-1-phosphate adenylyltransferase